MKRIGIVSLGCKVNQYETDKVVSFFLQDGFEIVSIKEKVDVYLVNTCSVTNTADKKTRQLLRRLHRFNPDADILVMGCFAQMWGEQLRSFAGVKVILGTLDREKIWDYWQESRRTNRIIYKVRQEQNPCYEEIKAPLASKRRTRAFLKIQDGCDQFCNYCIIPYARGRARSRCPEAVLKEGIQLAKNGYQEIVLTGINIGTYGRDLGGGIDLAVLLRDLAAIKGIERIRLGSIEPLEVTGSLLEVIKNESKFCPHLHIPLQSGSDKLLQSMNRPYNKNDFRELVARLQCAVPGLVLTTDVILGFPGETEEDFEDTCAFINEIGFADVHVFPFSVREGTRAAQMKEQVAEESKNQRCHWLNEEVMVRRKEFLAAQIQKEATVLLERQISIGKDSYWEGHTLHYLPVRIFSEQGVKGKICKVRILSVQEGRLMGEVLKDV